MKCEMHEWTINSVMNGEGQDEIDLICDKCSAVTSVIVEHENVYGDENE